MLPELGSRINLNRTFKLKFNGKRKSRLRKKKWKKLKCKQYKRPRRRERPKRRVKKILN